MPVIFEQALTGTPGGVSLKYHAYTPGSAGTGDGRARISLRAQRR